MGMIGEREINETCELDQPIWAVATQSEVIAIDLIYGQAIAVVNQNLGRTGIAIITSKAARRQMELDEVDQDDDDELEDPNAEHERNYNHDIAQSLRRRE